MINFRRIYMLIADFTTSKRPAGGLVVLLHILQGIAFTAGTVLPDNPKQLNFLTTTVANLKVVLSK